MKRNLNPQLKYFPTKMAKETVVTTLGETTLQLAARIEALLAKRTETRILVALAGVPGSGKSTVSQALLVELAARNIFDVAIVPMVRFLFFAPFDISPHCTHQQTTELKLKHVDTQDGFHYSKAVLSTFPDPDLAFKRRGAPFTFDALAFVALVKALKSMPVTTATSPEPEQFLYAPSFDHALKDPAPNAIAISSRTRLVIVEGNYTLLDQKPWNEIPPLCEEKWFVDVDREVVKERLAQRHLLAGIETSAMAAVRRAEENDLPNGELIRGLLVEPDVVIKN